MEQTPIPDDVRRFIAQCIPSVPYLEAILLMKSDAAAAWSPQQLARRLYISEAQASQLLLQLQAAGIAASPSRAQGEVFSFAPMASELRDMLELVEIAYRRHLIDVTSLIHVKANRKAQLFANAFIWRKES